MASDQYIQKLNQTASQFTLQPDLNKIFLTQYRQIYVTNRLMSKCLLYRTKMTKFDLTRSGQRLEWAVPNAVLKEMVEGMNELDSSSSPSFTMLEDSIEILRRPYDSHVNLAAGRTNHQIMENMYRTQVTGD
jgi:hypothetical protein